MQYLESRLVTLATLAKRCTLENGNSPALPSLSEADAADAEGFLDEMLLCFPVLGLNVFTAPAPVDRGGELLQLVSKGIIARGKETPDGFVVQAGSGAVRETTNSIHDYMKELRAALIDNGVLVPTGENYVFTQDYVFASPSTAGGVVQGAAANGRLLWKTTDGRTLKELQETEVGR